MGDELLANRLDRRRRISVKAGERGLKRALARAANLLPDRIIVVQIERLKKRPECQSLQDELPIHDARLVVGFVPPLRDHLAGR
jgi:hypothetical protein